MASPLSYRIKEGSDAVSRLFGGTAADNVYAGLQDVAKKQYGIGADELDRAKQAAETRATQQFARKRTHGGSAHAQSLSDIATKDIADRVKLANTAISGMRQGRSEYESLAPELYKLAASGGLANASGKGLSWGSKSGKPGVSWFSGGYEPGRATDASRALGTGGGRYKAGEYFKTAPRKYIL
tara:strand:+ start:968 stop:1516 length:549 start_codon:yes stop_codon:yes gene_type:complete